PATFQQFRHSARRRFDTRLYNKTDLELHALYQQGVMLARTVSSGERMRLTELRRHLAQAQRLIAPRQVFGEFAERDDLPALVTQWRAQADVQRIERVAKVKVSASPEQVSV